MTAFNPRILQQFFDELQFLWMQYQRALKSPDYKSRDLLWLEERVAANVDGLLVAGDEAVPLLEEAILGEESQPCFAAAYILLRMEGEAGTQKVLATFLEAKDKQLDGIREALCHSPIDRCAAQLREAVNSAPAPVALAAAEVLAFQHKLGATPTRLTELLKDELPTVRQRAWRVMAMLDLGSTTPGSSRRGPT